MYFTTECKTLISSVKERVANIGKVVIILVSSMVFLPIPVCGCLCVSVVIMVIDSLAYIIIKHHYFVAGKSVIFSKIEGKIGFV